MEHLENEQYSNLVRNIPKIEEALRLHFLHEQLLIQAFVHKSFLNEYAHVCPASYERLEFLGDSVLNMAVSEYLFRTYPERDEGALSQMKSQCVNQKSLAQTMSQFGINSYLMSGKGERIHRLYDQEAILADLYEALLGALFLDQGWEAVKSFILTSHLTRCTMGSMLSENPKAALQEWCLKHKLGLPKYTIVKEEGPQHDPTFTVSVLIQDKSIFEGSGRTKRQAESVAAKGAFITITSQTGEEK